QSLYVSAVVIVIYLQGKKTTSR
ncbi:MAG: hypothetical protein RL545_984, partial [Actinomycetota bacterium]